MKALLTKLFDIMFWKFILVGIVNTCVGTGVMFVMYNVFHCSYWLSSASNYVVGSVVSYLLNKFFTFKDQNKAPKTMVRFVINIALCYLVAYGGAQPIVKAIFSNADVALRDNLSMLCGMGLFVILNYIGQRFFVFRQEKKGGEKQ